MKYNNNENNDINLKTQLLNTDVLVIGGGTAGCFLGLSLNEDINVIIAEKANIKRSGCLAAGVNALNAYIGKGETPNSYVDYIVSEFDGIVREDLVYSIAKELNNVTKKIEDLGLAILKDESGNYVQRGKRSIKINGENIKPILADAVNKKSNITVINKLNIIDYLMKEDKVIGAYGFTLDTNELIFINAKVVVTATGGASGIYKPNNPGFSKHKMWYSPFNTGAGYGMGIRAGAEMTTFEMRFIALRCKDTIAPTGTIAQGINAKQVNSNNEKYINKYGKGTTINRLYSTILENEKGLGPCYLQTKGISKEIEEDLFKAYLNMAPAQTLKWIEKNSGPSKENVEIDGTEPYIVGGHTASGYWVDKYRRTNLKGLYAIGDVAGGSPKKYVTGCFAEGKIAANHINENINNLSIINIDDEVIYKKHKFILSMLNNRLSPFKAEELEDLMQTTMDKYAGGISNKYRYNKKDLLKAEEIIDELLIVSYKLKTNKMFELMMIFEVIDRLYICKVLIQHLLSRKETRWHCYQENTDYPNKNKEYLKYINSIYKDGKVHIIFRDLIRKNDVYEHTY